jgi:hypothetical protein
LNYTADAAARMIVEGKNYLENLLRSVDDNYKCIAFRASYLAAAPSPTLFNELAKKGIEIDSSITSGLKVETDDVQLDYTSCEEDFQPFYPQMTDARRVSGEKEPVVCVPIFHFTASRISAARQIISKIIKKAAGSEAPYKGLEMSGKRTSLRKNILERVLRPVLAGKHQTADVSRLALPVMREMLSAIRARARTAGLKKVPVVITNHSKYMVDFDGFDRFLGEVAAADDVRPITMSELASMLRAGELEIRRAA